MSLDSKWDWRDWRGIRFVSEERDTNWRDIREKVGEFLGISVEKYARDMATTGPGNCGQVIDVTGAHGRMRNKSGSIKVKERDEGIFFFSLFNLIETLCRIIY